MIGLWIVMDEVAMIRVFHCPSLFFCIDWSIFYVALAVILTVSAVLFLVWLACCCCLRK